MSNPFNITRRGLLQLGGLSLGSAALISADFSAETAPEEAGLLESSGSVTRAARPDRLRK